MNVEKRILVYGPNGLIGTVFVSSIRGKEVFSFEFFDAALLRGDHVFLLDPELMPVRGRQYKSDPSSPFGFLSDSSPDRWGRGLLSRANPGRLLLESDYLFGVSDVSRMGALRYKLDEGGPFLAQGDDVPPLSHLNALEEAAYGYDEFDGDDGWRILLSPGSSLGGARPKATVYDAKGQLYLAKFGHKDDGFDAPALEYLTYLLAKRCGIDASESKLLSVGGGRHAFLTKRFDRDAGKRIPYVSFMTLLGAKDGESDRHSYLDLASLLTQKSVTPAKDLRELFRRIAFSLVCHNYDDHLRNHGMAYMERGWALSPCFDVNISPYPGRSALPIGGDSIDPFAALIETCPYYRLGKMEAEQTILEIKETVNANFDADAKKAELDEGMAKAIKSRLGLSGR